jgi:hypothetical protein
MPRISYELSYIHKWFGLHMQIYGWATSEPTVDGMVTSELVGKARLSFQHKMFGLQLYIRLTLESQGLHLLSHMYILYMPWIIFKHEGFIGVPGVTSRACIARERELKGRCRTLMPVSRLSQ